VPLQQGAGVAVAGLFLSVEEELEIHAGRDAAGAQCIERHEHRDDRRLVVAGGSGVQPPLGSRGAVGGRQRNDVPAALERRVAQRRLPRWSGPFRRFDGLAVVMRVKDDRRRGAGGCQLAIHDRRPTGRRFEEPNGDSAPSHHRRHGRRVAPDVHAVAGQIREGEQVGELSQDRRLMGGAVTGDDASYSVGTGGRWPLRGHGQRPRRRQHRRDGEPRARGSKDCAEEHPPCTPPRRTEARGDRHCRGASDATRWRRCAFSRMTIPLSERLFHDR
jgi:hypothetical protein